MTKAELRKIIAHDNNELTKEYKRSADETIRNSILSLPEYRKASVIFCFAGKGDEIDTLPLIDAMLEDGKTVCVPLCTGKGIMEAKRISAGSELSAGRYGIPEPPAAAETVPPESIGLAVIPCVTCSRAGRRLGRGGGYYDRYFAGLNTACALVCREKSMTADIPVEPHDILFGTVVSERGVYRNAL